MSCAVNNELKRKLTTSQFSMKIFLEVKVSFINLKCQRFFPLVSIFGLCYYEYYQKHSPVNSNVKLDYFHLQLLVEIICKFKMSAVLHEWKE